MMEKTTTNLKKELEELNKSLELIMHGREVPSLDLDPPSNVVDISQGFYTKRYEKRQKKESPDGFVGYASDARKKRQEKQRKKDNERVVRSMKKRGN